MKIYSDRIKILCFLVLSLSILGCEIRKKGAKNDPEYGEQGKAAVGSFFLIEQAAISNAPYQELRSAMSTLMGRGVVMTDTSSFVKWYSPQLGCRLYSDDLAEVGLIRSLDIGDLAIKDPSGADIKLSRDPKEYYFAARGLLNPGAASLSTTGSKGSFIVNHNFTVPGMGSQIEFENINTGDKERLPSPSVVNPPADGAPDSENYYVSLSRAAGYKVSYRAPAGTSFVKITLQDNPSNSANWVVCYGEPQSEILVPQGMLSQTRATREALLTIDFVNVDARKNFPRMKESLVITFSRHYHGRRDLNDLGINDPAFFGRLTLE